MEQTPAATPLQRARRQPGIPDLGFICSACGGRTRSELNSWAQWYTAGERWLEECTHCGAVWSVRLQAERYK